MTSKDFQTTFEGNKPWLIQASHPSKLLSPFTTLRLYQQLCTMQVGNMYIAYLYVAFVSLLHNKHSSLDGKRVILFSYGSGSTATMFSLRLNAGQQPFSSKQWFTKFISISTLVFLVFLLLAIYFLVLQV